MSVESTRKVVRKYWDSDHSDVSMMAEDVVFTVMASGQEAHGPDGVVGLLNYFYHVAFDATAENTTEIVENGKAVWDGYSVGKHIGEFALAELAARDPDGQVRRAHAAFYSALVAEARQHLYSPHQLRWLQAVALERDNVRAALAWYRHRDPTAGLALPDTPEIRSLFHAEMVDDILLVITYGGRTPNWPE
jgi:hypothetical protein